MRHSANELIFTGNILAADALTVLATGIPCGETDLSGRALEQAQLRSSSVSAMILMRYPDALALTDSGYVQIEDSLYVVDYSLDPGQPRPKMWREIYAHIERSGN